MLIPLLYHTPYFLNVLILGCLFFAINLMWALVVGTAGTLNFIDGSGNDVVGFPAQAGYNPITVTRVKTGGTAANIWAIY